MGFDRLPVVVLQQIRERSLKCARRSAGESRCVPAGFDTVSGGLVPDQPNVGIVDERVEDADRVGPAADTCRHRIGQPARLRQDLRPRFQPDDTLESRAPSSGTDADRRLCRSSNTCCPRWSPNRGTPR